MAPERRRKKDKQDGRRFGDLAGALLLQCGRTFAATYLPISSMFLAVGALHHGPLGAYRNFTLISLLVYLQAGHCVLPR